MSIVKNIELENQTYDIHGKNVQHISWQDYQNLEDKSGDIAYFIEGAPSQKAEGFLSDLPTGSISTVNDAAPLPLNALTVSVEAWQEGTGDPSPSNVRPIHGGDSGKITDEGASLLADKKYLLNSENVFLGADTSSDVEYYLKSGTYHFTITYAQGIDKMSKRINYAIRDGSTIYFNYGDTDVEITLQADGYYRFWINSNNRMTVDDVASFALILPRIYTQQFPTTIYGAEWDVVGGGMKVTDSYILADGDTVLCNARYGDGANRMPAFSIQSPFSGEVVDVSTNYLKTVAGSAVASTRNSITIVGGNLVVLHIEDIQGVGDGQSYATNAELYAAANAYLQNNNLQIKYKLATPTTIDLSPLSIRMLQGVNNVYADCGEVIEGEYWAEQSSAQIRMNDEVIASDATQYAVQSEFAKKADNACTFTVDEEQELLIINWVNQSQ